MIQTIRFLIAAKVLLLLFASSVYATDDGFIDQDYAANIKIFISNGDSKKDEVIKEFVVSQALSKGVPEHKISSYLSMEKGTIISISEKYFPIISQILNKTDSLWSSQTDTTPQQRMIRNDFAEVLATQTNAVKDLISKAKNLVLESSPINLSELSQFLSTIPAHGLLEGESIPQRMRVEDSNGINLGKMTSAELDWYKQLDSITFSLKKLIEAIIRFEDNELKNIYEKKTEYHNAVKTLTDHYNQKDGIPQLSKDDLEKFLEENARQDKILIESIGNLLLSSVFSARHSQYQWTKINPVEILPLNTHLLLRSIEIAENHPNFKSSFWKRSEIEIPILLTLISYLREDIKIEGAILKVLACLSKIDELDPFIRLTAYGMIEKEIGQDKAQLETELNSSKLEALYRMTNLKIIRSPSRQGAAPKAHIEYPKHFKMPVEELVQLVEKIMSKRGLSPLEIPTRTEVYDSKLSRSGSQDEKLLQRIRQNHIEEKTKTTIKDDSPIVLPPIKSKYFVKFRDMIITSLENGTVQIKSNGKVIKNIFHVTKTRPTIEIVNSNLVIRYEDLSLGVVYRFAPKIYNFEKAFEFEPMEYLRDRVLRSCTKLFNF